LCAGGAATDLTPVSRATRAPAQVVCVRGFSLVELIMVMVIMAVLGAIGVGRFFDSRGSDAASYAAQVKTMVRYAQKVAIAQHRVVYVQLGASSVGLCYQSTCSAASIVPSPAGNNSGSSNTKAQCTIGGAYAATWMCEAMPSSVSLSTSRSVPNSLFFFDSIGRPYASGDTSPTSSFTQLVLTYTGGGSSSAITVEQETGYVH
jgi:MSHA pilin protein MshC